MGSKLSSGGLLAGTLVVKPAAGGKAVAFQKEDTTKASEETTIAPANLLVLDFHQRTPSPTASNISFVPTPVSDIPSPSVKDQDTFPIKDNEEESLEKTSKGTLRRA